MVILPAAVVLLASVVPAPAVAPADDAQRLRVVARTTSRWRWSGVAVGLVAAWATAQVGSLGRGVMLAAPVLALCVLVAVVLGELRVRPPDGAVRRAVLETRRIRDYVPRGLSIAVGGAAAMTAGVLVGTTLVASSDDLGRGGRWLVVRSSDLVIGAAGPWPGSYYAVPLAVVLAGGLLTAGGALWQVVRRPRQGESREVDDALRRHGVSSIVAAVGVLVAVPLAGVSLVAAAALINVRVGMAGGTLSWLTWPAVALFVLALAALVLAGISTGTLLRPLRIDVVQASSVGCSESDCQRAANVFVINGLG